MNRLIPVVVAVVAIVLLTIVEGSISDRWSDSNRAAAYCATLLNDIPDTIGDWEGVDEEVTDAVIEVAGAEGFISRDYRNKNTGQRVNVWLIVGHARDTAEHTPDICYPSQGFRQCQKNTQYPITLPNGKEVGFWTAAFEQKVGIQKAASRVFWTWFKPALSGEGDVTQVDWVAPENARFHFGSTRALYKLYFTANGVDPEQAPEESVCLEFAGEFITVANEVLKKANNEPPADFATGGKSSDSAA